MGAGGATAALTMLAGSLLLASAAANVDTPYCAIADSRGLPHLGDGPAVGDAPAEPPVPTPLGCYSGRLRGPSDVDAFRLMGANQLRIAFQAGCGDVRLEVESIGFEDGWSLCQGEPRTLLLPRLSTARLVFAGGPADYWFAYD
jgi:hypothetical protein